MFPGITPAQRSQNTNSQLQQNRSTHSSGVDKLRSQNLLFNSGESCNYRQREESRDRNYDSRHNNREREEFPSRDPFIGTFHRKERMIITDAIIAKIMIGTEV
jgi:hypothetical protein